MSEPVRGRILSAATSATLGDREENYGSPLINMLNIATLFEGYFRARGWIVQRDDTVTAEDVAQIMTLLKMGRTINHALPYHEDNYVDASAYMAIAGECAEQERNS